MLGFIKRTGMIYKGKADYRKNEENRTYEEMVQEVSAVAMLGNHSEDGDMAKDLAVLVGDAIQAWACRYGLENLPKDIIMDQAISIMMTVRKTM